MYGPDTHSNRFIQRNDHLFDQARADTAFSEAGSGAGLGFSLSGADTGLCSRAGANTGLCLADSSDEMVAGL